MMTSIECKATAEVVNSHFKMLSKWCVSWQDRCLKLSFYVYVFLATIIILYRLVAGNYHNVYPLRLNNVQALWRWRAAHSVVIMLEGEDDFTNKSGCWHHFGLLIVGEKLAIAGK